MKNCMTNMHNQRLEYVQAHSCYILDPHLNMFQDQVNRFLINDKISYPKDLGTEGQVLTTDGSNHVSWLNIPAEIPMAPSWDKDHHEPYKTGDYVIHNHRLYIRLNDEDPEALEEQWIDVNWQEVYITEEFYKTRIKISEVENESIRRDDALETKIDEAEARSIERDNALEARVDEIEEVSSNALCDLDYRVTTLDKKTDEIEEVSSTALCDLDNRINEVEEVSSTALCDLDNRINEVEEVSSTALCDLDNKVTTLGQRADEIEEISASALCNLDGKIVNVQNVAINADTKAVIALTNVNVALQQIVEDRQSIKKLENSTWSPWKEGKVYTKDMFIIHDGTLYICLSTHTSTTFEEELKSGYWKITSLENIVTNLNIEINDKSKVSGTASGDNWSSITIDGTTKNIPVGGSGEPDAYIKSASTNNGTLTLTKKDNSNIAFTPVEANPTSAGTQTLTKLKVGSNIFNVPQGGSSTTVVYSSDVQSQSKITIGGITVNGGLRQDISIPKYLAGNNISITQDPTSLDYTISSTGGGGGTSNYDDLSNKPKINNVLLSGNKTASQLGLVEPSDLTNYLQTSAIDANPSSTAEETLNRIEIKGTVYNIPSGGSSGVSDITVTPSYTEGVAVASITWTTDGTPSTAIIKAPTAGEGGVNDVTLNGSSIVTDGTATVPINGTTADDNHLATTKYVTDHAGYVKPSGGIPSTDLTSAVQASLGLANTALQSHQDISGKENISNKVTSIVDTGTDTLYPTTQAVYDFVDHNYAPIGNYPTTEAPSGEPRITKIWSGPERDLPDTKLSTTLYIVL